MQSVARGLFNNHKTFRHTVTYSLNATTSYQHTLTHPTMIVSSGLVNNQVRHGANHLSLSLKGRRGWKKVLQKKTLMKRSAVSAGVSVGKVKGSQRDAATQQMEKAWTPETPIEILYVKYMNEINTTRKRHSTTPVDELLDAVEKKEDLQYALRVWRVLVYRNIKFKPQTTDKLIKKLIQFDDIDSVADVLLNSKELRMPVTRQIALDVIDLFLNSGEDARVEQATLILERAIREQYPFYLNPQSEEVEKVLLHLKNTGADHNERVVKTLYPLIKFTDKNKALRILSQLSPEAKSYLIEACTSQSQNNKAVRLATMLQVAVLQDAQLFEQIEAIVTASQSQNKEASAEGGEASSE